jgi:flagellin-specific chaperone FliS
MSARDSIKEKRVSSFGILSILSLLILATSFTVLAVILYLYDAEVRDAIQAAKEIRRQNALTFERAEEQVRQHDNITMVLSEQLSQHERITKILSEQIKEHEFLTSGLINVTDSNTVILEAVNATVTDEDLERSVSVKIDDLKRSLDELKETLGLNLTALNETTTEQQQTNISKS